MRQPEWAARESVTGTGSCSKTITSQVSSLGGAVEQQKQVRGHSGYKHLGE